MTRFPGALLLYTFAHLSCTLKNELREVLGKYADSGVNFVEGAPLNERNRVEVFTDDQGLYRTIQVMPGF